MNKDLHLFEKITNRLVYLTTRDEYGTSRSRGISTHGELAEDLNQEGLVPKTGSWTETSLRLFLNRVPKRYDEEAVRELCDFSFIGRSAWEYQSQTKREEVIGNPRGSNLKLEQSSYARSYPLHQPVSTETENWKSREIEEVTRQDEKNEKLLKHMTRNRQFVT